MTKGNFLTFSFAKRHSVSLEVYQPNLAECERLIKTVMREGQVKAISGCRPKQMQGGHDRPFSEKIAQSENYWTVPFHAPYRGTFLGARFCVASGCLFYHDITPVTDVFLYLYAIFYMASGPITLSPWIPAFSWICSQAWLFKREITDGLCSHGWHAVLNTLAWWNIYDFIWYSVQSIGPKKTCSFH